MLKKSFAFFAFTLIILCAFSLTAKAEIVDQSGMLSGYSTVYELNVPASMNYSSSEPAYSVNNTASLATNNYLVDKIGYYLSLTYKDSGATEWVAITMDAFTSDFTKMGIPTFGSKAVFQQYVTNPAYKSNAAALNNGTISAASGITMGSTLSNWDRTLSTRMAETSSWKSTPSVSPMPIAAFRAEVSASRSISVISTE